MMENEKKFKLTVCITLIVLTISALLLSGCTVTPVYPPTDCREEIIKKGYIEPASYGSNVFTDDCKNIILNKNNI